MAFWHSYLTALKRFRYSFVLSGSFLGHIGIELEELVLYIPPMNFRFLFQGELACSSAECSVFKNWLRSGNRMKDEIFLLW